jgi:hypothetical protein
MPDNIWVGIIAATGVPYLTLSIFFGLMSNIDLAMFSLSIGIFVISPLILFILPLSYFVLRKFRTIHFIQILVLGFWLPILPILLINLWTYIEGPIGTYRGSAGYHYIDGEWTKTGLINLFIYGPLYMCPLGILGAISGWFAAFGFRASVDVKSLG